MTNMNVNELIKAVDHAAGMNARAEPGQFVTDPKHLHSPHRRIVQHSLEHLLDRARLIGAQTGSWAEAMLQQRGPIGVRVLHGLLALAQKHPLKALEAAAQKALHHGAWRLRDLRLLLEQNGSAPQLDFLERGAEAERSVWRIAAEAQRPLPSGRRKLAAPAAYCGCPPVRSARFAK